MMIVFSNVLQLFSRESGPAGSRQKIEPESAPYVIKNDTDMTLKITFGKYYQVSPLLTYSLTLPRLV